MATKLQTWCKQLNDYGKKRTPFLCYVDFELQKPVVIKLSEINNKDLCYNFAGRMNFTSRETSSQKTSFTKKPISFEEFSSRFDKVKQHLQFGNSFLVNLTFPTAITTNLSLKEIFIRAKQPYKLYVRDAFAVFSPEKFIQINRNQIHSFPMKGTIDANKENAQKILLESQKEKAEHATITDLIRNDLSQVATHVDVVNYRYIDKIRTNQKDLLQVSSHIQGELGINWQSKIGDILLRLLPAGSVSGAPKTKTLEIIKEAEIEARGYYTGVMGIFDGDSFESAVMIRYVEKSGEKLIFRSGGGITAQSSAVDEYHEMVDKVYLPWRDKP